SLYGPIIYQKAPIVVAQLERMTGEQALREGLRDYLREHAYGNASWPDLIAILDKRIPANLAAWSNAWVEQRGRPEVAARIREGRLTLTQRDPFDRGLVWPQRLEVLVADAKGTRRIPVELDQASAEVPLPEEMGYPLFVLPGGTS